MLTPLWHSQALAAALYRGIGINLHFPHVLNV